jgi:hypothetical protein
MFYDANNSNYYEKSVEPSTDQESNFSVIFDLKKPKKPIIISEKRKILNISNQKLSEISNLKAKIGNFHFITVNIS